MTLNIILGDGYKPNYIRTDLTDDLHKWAGFRTEAKIVTTKRIKKIISNIKDNNSLGITTKSVV